MAFEFYESETCPITEDVELVAQTEFGELRVSRIIDHVMRFDPEHFDYLLYYNQATSSHSMIFLGKTALDTLVEYGVPETPRDSITPREYGCWLESVVSTELLGLDDEVEGEL